MAKALPARADLINYNQAVAGHDGTLCDADGELFIKPCTQQEIDFYQSSIALHPHFADVMPTFLGTLSLDEQPNGKTIEEAGAELLATTNGISVAEAGAVLASNGVKSSCNGVSHHEVVITPVPESAALPVQEPVTIRKPGKRLVTKQAVVLENASHGFVQPNIMDVKLGVRLWADDAAEEKQIRFNKITAETTHKDLGFRVAGMRVWQGHNAKGKDIDSEGYKLYDKDYGRYFLHNDNVHEAFRSFLFTKTAGVDEELGKLVAQAFLADVKNIQAVMEGQESRMFSASLLFVFEGDGEALRKAMEEATHPPPYTDEESEEEVEGPKIYVVKVIDFAHAEWVPGRGPDENCLLGVRNVAKILENLGPAHEMSLSQEASSSYTSAVL